MEWIILEALVSLALGLAILVWVLSPARRRDREKELHDAREQRRAQPDDDVR